VSTEDEYYFIATATFSGGSALSMTGTMIITKIA
jgi:hypothetical protein